MSTIEDLIAQKQARINDLHRMNPARTACIPSWISSRDWNEEGYGTPCVFFAVAFGLS